jgi:hypothetical protein
MLYFCPEKARTFRRKNSNAAAKPEVEPAKPKADKKATAGAQAAKGAPTTDFSFDRWVGRRKSHVQAVPVSACLPRDLTSLPAKNSQEA